MFIISTFLFISSISSVIRRDLSIHISRASIILLVCCVFLAYYTTNFAIVGKGIGLFGDLLYVSPLTQNLKTFIFLLSTVILSIASFYPRNQEYIRKSNKKENIKDYISFIKISEKSDLSRPNVFKEHCEIFVCKTLFLIVLSYIVYLSYKNGLAFYMQSVSIQILSILAVYKPYITRWSIELLLLFVIINILIIMFYMFDVLYLDTLINHMDISKLLNPEPNPGESSPIPENNVTQNAPKTVINLHSYDYKPSNGLQYRVIYDKNELAGNNLIKVTEASNEYGSRVHIITSRVMGSPTTGIFKADMPHHMWDKHNHEMVSVNNKWGFWDNAPTKTTLEQNNVLVKHDRENILLQVIDNKLKWFIQSSQTKR